MQPNNPIKLAWAKKVSPRFAQKVLKICRGYCWTSDHANWLMACMAFETDETFHPDIRNAAGSGACGLIQFMPATVTYLGYAMREIELMTAEEQLQVVNDYFIPYSRRIKSLSDMYMAILLPKYIGQPDDTVLFSRPGVAYRQNSGLDADQNGKITKAEATARVAAKLHKGLNLAYAGFVTQEI